MVPEIYIAAHLVCQPQLVFKVGDLQLEPFLLLQRLVQPILEVLVRLCQLGVLSL